MDTSIGMPDSQESSGQAYDQALNSGKIPSARAVYQRERRVVYKLRAMNQGSPVACEVQTRAMAGLT